MVTEWPDCNAYFAEQIPENPAPIITMFNFAMAFDLNEKQNNSVENINFAIKRSESLTDNRLTDYYHSCDDEHAFYSIT